MFCGVSRVTERGQVTIPQELRLEEGIREGTEVMFFKTSQGIVLLTGKEINALFDVFTQRAKELGLTKEELEKEVKEIRGKK